MFQHSKALFQGAPSAAGERQGMKRGSPRLKINRLRMPIFCKEKEKQDIEDWR